MTRAKTQPAKRQWGLGLQEHAVQGGEVVWWKPLDEGRD